MTTIEPPLDDERPGVTWYVMDDGASEWKRFDGPRIVSRCDEPCTWPKLVTLAPWDLDMGTSWASKLFDAPVVNS